MTASGITIKHGLTRPTAHVAVSDQLVTSTLVTLGGEGFVSCFRLKVWVVFFVNGVISIWHWVTDFLD
jgi:hypothetical protein